MSWISFVSGLVSLVLELLRLFQRRADLDQAKLAAAVELLEKANELIARAQLSSANVDDSESAVVLDPNNRDNEPNERGRDP